MGAEKKVSSPQRHGVEMEPLSGVNFGAKDLPNLRQAAEILLHIRFKDDGLYQKAQDLVDYFGAEIGIIVQELKKLEEGTSTQDESVRLSRSSEPFRFEDLPYLRQTLEILKDFGVKAHHEGIEQRGGSEKLKQLVKDIKDYLESEIERIVQAQDEKPE